MHTWFHIRKLNHPPIFGKNIKYTLESDSFILTQTSFRFDMTASLLAIQFSLPINIASKYVSLFTSYLVWMILIWKPGLGHFTVFLAYGLVFHPSHGTPSLGTPQNTTTWSCTWYSQEFFVNLASNFHVKRRGSVWAKLCENDVKSNVIGAYDIGFDVNSEL